MPAMPVARVGDHVFNPADTHPGSPPLPVSGRIQQGSPNVYVNDKPAAICNPALVSMHAGCNFANTFYCYEGAPKTYVNDFQLARSGDPTAHCGSVQAGLGGTGSLGKINPLCSTNTFAQ